MCVSLRTMIALIAVPALALSALAETTGSPAAVPPAPKASSPAKEGTVSPAQGSASDAQAKGEEKKKLSAKEEFAQEMKRCQDAWDAGTNMTKSQWRQVCHRTLSYRLPYKSNAAKARP